MGRFIEAPNGKGSQFWLREAVNRSPAILNAQMSRLFGFHADEEVQWLSPLFADDYAEYSDRDFLAKLGLQGLSTQLKEFWPRGGPHWDALARTSSNKVILVEAKGHVDEYRSRDSDATAVSLKKIMGSLETARLAFGANPNRPWGSPYYQYVNRLAHLHFLRDVGGVDAYLLFLNFSNTPNMNSASTDTAWKQASSDIKQALGLGGHPYETSVGTLILSTEDVARASASSDMLQ